MKTIQCGECGYKNTSEERVSLLCLKMMQVYILLLNSFSCFFFFFGLTQQAKIKHSVICLLIYSVSRVHGERWNRLFALSFVSLASLAMRWSISTEYRVSRSLLLVYGEYERVEFCFIWWMECSEECIIITFVEARRVFTCDVHPHHTATWSEFTAANSGRHQVYLRCSLFLLICVMSHNGRGRRLNATHHLISARRIKTTLHEFSRVHTTSSRERQTSSFSFHSSHLPSSSSASCSMHIAPVNTSISISLITSQI